MFHTNTSGCFTKPLKVVAQKSHLDTTDDETMTKSIKPREVQKTVNTTYKNKKLQTATMKLSNNKPKMIGNATKIQTQAQVDKNFHNSATSDDTMKRKKKAYNKKNPTDLSDDSSDEQEKKIKPK